MLDAVNVCVTEWMNATAWTEADTDWINLLNWLDDQSTVTTADPLLIDVVAPPDDLTGGDVSNGRELFNTRCIVCHGFDGAGTQLAPLITGIGLPTDYIARRIRTSGPPDSVAYDGLVEGVMPFWGADRLSDGELVDYSCLCSIRGGCRYRHGWGRPDEFGCNGLQQYQCQDRSERYPE